MWSSVQGAQGLPGTALGEEKKGGGGWLYPGDGFHVVLRGYPEAKGQRAFPAGEAAAFAGSWRLAGSN